MIDVIKEIVMILTGCLTAFGGWELVRYLLNRKSNGRKAEAEAEVAEATAERMKLENFLKAFEFSHPIPQNNNTGNHLKLHISEGTITFH